MIRRSASKLLVAGLIAAGAAAVLHAQTPMNARLGLWEMSVSNKIAGMPDMPAMPQVDLSNVPPDQRERVEAMMKARQGMMGGAPIVTKQCLTKEKLEKPFYEDRQRMDQQGCKRTPVTTTATVQEYKIECSGETKMSGVIRFEAVDTEHVKGTFHMNSEAQGRPMTVDSAITGKWIGADCGDVK